MTHNICFILLAVDKENNNDPLKIWGLYLSVLAFPRECVNQLGSEVKSFPERSAGWFKTLDVWHRLMLCDIFFFLLVWSLELIKPYLKLLHNCHVSSWRPHHPDFEIFDGSRLTQPLNNFAPVFGNSALWTTISHVKSQPDLWQTTGAFWSNYFKMAFPFWQCTLLIKIKRHTEDISVVRVIYIYIEIYCRD